MTLLLLLRSSADEGPVAPARTHTVKAHVMARGVRAPVRRDVKITRRERGVR